MRSEFRDGFEKTAFIGPAIAGGARMIGGALARGVAGAGRLIGRGVSGTVRGGANLFTRATTGNIRKPLTMVDKGFGALGALGVANDYADYSKKLRNASMR